MYMLYSELNILLEYDDLVLVIENQEKNAALADLPFLAASDIYNTFSKNKCTLCSIAAPTFIEAVATI